MPTFPQPPSGPNMRGNVAALVAILLVAAALFWVMSATRGHNALQNCIDSGRRDCIPIESGR